MTNGPNSIGIISRYQPGSSTGAAPHPLQPEELNRMAAAAGLKLVRKIRCTTVVGVEHTVLLEKCAAVKASSVE